MTVRIYLRIRTLQLSLVVILGNVNCILKAEHKISIDIQKPHQRTTNVEWRSRALL